MHACVFQQPICADAMSKMSLRCPNVHVSINCVVCVSMHMQHIQHTLFEHEGIPTCTRLRVEDMEEACIRGLH